MGEQKRKKNISVGLLAHVDAGKTTLCEQMLLHSGMLRKGGRVDHGDAFMDGMRLSARAASRSSASRRPSICRGRTERPCRSR